MYQYEYNKLQNDAGKKPSPFTNEISMYIVNDDDRREEAPPDMKEMFSLNESQNLNTNKIPPKKKSFIMIKRWNKIMKSMNGNRKGRGKGIKIISFNNGNSSP